MTTDELVAVIFCGLLLSAILMALVPAIVISHKIAREEEDAYWQKFSEACRKDIKNDR